MLEAMGRDDDAEKKAVGARLLAARKAKGLSLGAAASAIGVDKSTIQRWQSGELQPRDHWPRVCEVYGVTKMAMLFGVDGPVDQEPPYEGWREFETWLETADMRHMVQPWMLKTLRAIRAGEGLTLPAPVYQQLLVVLLGARRTEAK